MNTLLLLRHGDAPRAPGETDADRTLSKLGYEESEKVANFLNSKNLEITHIVSSNSIRTRQTVGKILETYSFNPKVTFIPELYNASGHEILECINSQDDSIKSLMIVGHNPGITSILDLINPTGESQEIIKSRDFEATCKLVHLNGEFTNWSSVGASKISIEATFLP